MDASELATLMSVVLASADLQTGPREHKRLTARSSAATRLPGRIRDPGGNGARGRISPTAGPAEPASAQFARVLTRDRRNRPMIAKEFISAKTFRAQSAMPLGLFSPLLPGGSFSNYCPASAAAVP